MTLPSAQADLLLLAKDGVRQARLHWWNETRRFYNDRLNRNWRANMPLARLWTLFPLFETVNAIAIAEPTRANRAAVHGLARHARRYWNPSLESIGGFGWYVDKRQPWFNAYYDDNGWWGIAFLDAYRATGDRTYIRDAARAFRFIVDAGWDPGEGGIWWDSRQHHKTAEPLAAAALIGAKLYRITDDPAYLEEVKRLLSWANRRSWNKRRRLYQRSDRDDVVMNYVQGMMIEAHLELCRVLKQSGHCRRAQQLAEASLVAFPADSDWSPPNDAIYLRFMLDLYRHGRDSRWYSLAYRNARRALAYGRGREGLFLRMWDGTGVEGGLLRMHAATTSLFAWLAASEPATA